MGIMNLLQEEEEKKNVVTHKVLNRDTSVSVGYLQVSSCSSKHANELRSFKTTAASM